jgi:DNA (cytosine-5)-methyltransferase 1
MVLGFNEKCCKFKYPRVMGKKAPTFLSTFSGLGGLDLGLEMAGFRNIGCIELNEVARMSLRANHIRRRLIGPHDITQVAAKLKPRDLGIRKRELFMLAGGPPCQPFSKAAQWSHQAMKGLKDPRAKCFAGFIQLIETFLPQVVLIENVQGFVAGRTKVVSKLRKSLREINKTNGTKYRLQFQVVDAADYGVPQRRKRAILFAHRAGARFDFPTAITADKQVTAWEAFRFLKHRKQKPKQPGHWGHLLPSIPEGQNYLYHTRHGGGKALFGYRTRFWSFLLKLAKNQPAWTIPAQPGPYTGPFHWENRPLTEAELLRLQSFPASWQVKGGRIEKVRQIGNATPPLLAEIIGRSITTQFLEKQYRLGPRLAISRVASDIPSPEDVMALPRRFRNLIKRHRDHPGTGLGPRPISTPDIDEKKESKAA